MTAALTALVSQYGLVAVFAGAFLEGEGILIVAGILAGQGLLHPVSVWVAASLGAWLGHLFWFLVGRMVGRQHLLDRLTWIGDPLDRADRVIQRHPGAAVFLLQYLYGTRIIGAMAFGLTHLSLGRFLWYEALNCSIWAALVESLGYFLGETGSRIFHGWGKWLWLALSLALVVWLLHSLTSHRLGKEKRS
jgi:membrane-associated protein